MWGTLCFLLEVVFLNDPIQGRLTNANLIADLNLGHTGIEKRYNSVTLGHSSGLATCVLIGLCLWVVLEKLCSGLRARNI